MNKQAALVFLLLVIGALAGVGSGMVGFLMVGPNAHPLDASISGALTMVAMQLLVAFMRGD